MSCTPHMFNDDVLDLYFNREQLKLKNRFKQFPDFDLYMRGSNSFAIIKNLEVDTSNLPPVRIISPEKLAGSWKRVNEIVYDLQVCNDAANYSGKDKYTHFTRPAKLAQQLDVRIDSESLEKLAELHDAWVLQKLDDPNTFRNMFPKARYKSCMRAAEHRPNVHNFAVYDSNKNLVACRTISIVGDSAYLLSAFHVKFSPAAVGTAVDFVIRKKLFEIGVRYYNLGVGMGKSNPLEVYKRKIPHFEISFYQKSASSKPKPIIEQKTITQPTFL